MHIFIDESGSFVFTEDHNSWSAVGAVVILEEAMGAAENVLHQFKAENGVAPDDELKFGKVNDELSYFRLLNRLAQLNCTLYSLATDAHLNTPEAVAAHKIKSAEKIVEHIDKMVHQTLRDDIQKISNQVLSLSDQLYIQFICQTKLMYHVVSQAMTYYVQTNPESLGSFVWRVDGKDPKKITDYENAFELLSPPYLQSMSIADPMPVIEGFDYSHMARYEFSEAERPTYLRDHYGIDVKMTNALDIKKLIREDLQFINSKSHFGIQLADLLTGGIRRCLRREFKDNLRAAAFLGRLMVNRGRSQQPVLLLTLGEENSLDRPTTELINMMTRQQRAMITW
ncbi:DUF3800 domain-containing protein [Pseudomonas koreensis]|uniref:DUF3800 domain-containing protein n=1 Tax=Pseudomonas koreensis TaxID=198620 RepID=UPI00147290B1|nr:DUF3800 domain-containing protein [Pseudomonas koreensis]NNA54771.1 DUF3800 domain-containing protein [Pseudomonas koreensis]